MTPTPSATLMWRPSRILAVLVLALYGATAALVIALPLAHIARAGIALAAGIAGGGTLWNTMGARAPRRCRVDLDRRILVTACDGTTRCGEVLADSYVGPWLTTIVWRPDGARLARALPILPDAASAEELRQLRVVLRYSRAAAETAGSNGVDAA